MLRKTVTAFIVVFIGLQDQRSSLESTRKRSHPAPFFDVERRPPDDLASLAMFVS